MQAIDLSKGTLIRQARFCSTVNYQSDAVYLDSCSRFRERYSSSADVSQSDSLYNCDRQLNLTCKQSRKFTDYTCICAK
jgi:hypothetical protein